MSGIPHTVDSGDNALATEVRGGCDSYLLLAGRPPFDEFISYYHRAANGRKVDIWAASETWRTAAAHLQRLSLMPAGGLGLGSSIAPLSEVLESVATDLAQTRNVQVVMSQLPSQLAMVELSSLAVRQKHINRSYCSTLSSRVPSPSDLLAAFDFCLRPDIFGLPTVSRVPTPNGGFVFTGASNDLRVLEVKVLEPESLPGVDLDGSPQHVLVVSVGYGPNLLTVLRGNNRMLIQNGSHRAFALMEAGHAQAPALVQDIADDLQLALAVGPQAAQPAIAAMYSPQRPPLLRDFLDPDLHVVLDYPHRDTAVRVTLGFEVSEIPQVVHQVTNAPDREPVGSGGLRIEVAGAPQRAADRVGQSHSMLVHGGTSGRPGIS